VEIRLITEAGSRPVSPDSVDEVLVQGEGFLWIDLDHTDEKGMALLTNNIKVNPTDLEQCHNRTPVPLLHVYAGYLFSAINGLARGVDGRLHFQPLKAFMTTKLLFTVIGPCHEALTYEAAHSELIKYRSLLDADEVRPATPLGLLSSIRFQMLHAQEEMTRWAASRISELERLMLLRDPVQSESLLQDLFALRHDVQTIRTNAAQTYETFHHLIETLESQQGLMPVDPRRIQELLQGFGHLRNTADLEREYLQELLDLFQTRVSTELNRFVRKVTAWGFIGISWTVIAGIYGMNFTVMPELNWTYGYAWSLGVMLAVGVVLYVVFHRRGWL
jgi:magnesium transporter